MPFGKRIGKPKLFHSKQIVPPLPGMTADDYAVYASYRPSPGGGYYGTLKVVRKTDNRLLFPFAGAPSLGPFPTKHEGVAAAEAVAHSIVEGDITNPEL
jgi:hypothetical protein